MLPDIFTSPLVSGICLPEVLIPKSLETFTFWELCPSVGLIIVPVDPLITFAHPFKDLVFWPVNPDILIGS